MGAARQGPLRSGSAPAAPAPTAGALRAGPNGRNAGAARRPLERPERSKADPEEGSQESGGSSTAVRPPSSAGAEERAGTKCERSECQEMSGTGTDSRAGARGPGGVDGSGGRDHPERGVGATGRRWSRRSVSARSRFSLRALHGRHEATTFSQLCSPPRDRGRRGRCSRPGRLQYWQRWPSRAKTARRDSGTRDRYGTRTKWVSRMTVGTGTDALGMELGVIARDDDGLLLEDQHHRPPNRDDAERLEAGVEHQRSSQASRPPPILSAGILCSRVRAGPPLPRSRPASLAVGRRLRLSCLHHRRSTTRSAGVRLAGPYWVSSRNRT